jgi:3'-5' exoribonuclease
LIGAALHDIGKLIELDTDNIGAADYSLAGNLFGHLYLGIQMVEQVASTGRYDRNEVVQIEHMIASHHGKQEFGAIQTPHTLEAQVLNFIDDMDAKIYVFENELSQLESGELATTGKTMLQNARVWKPAQ